jgi:glycosyltransferase involved in cell wall biosynthesis
MNTKYHALRVGYLLRSYPRLSQTFILNEILALEQLGVQIHIFAVTHPHEEIVQPQVAQVQAPVDYLEGAEGRRWWIILWEHLLTFLFAPLRYLRTARYVLAHPEFDQGYTASSRFVCFVQAVYLARLLRRLHRRGQGVDQLHAHFAHDPTLIAQLVHRLTGIAYTFTGHARDLYQIPQKALGERIQEARAVVTCCAVNVDYLKQTAPVTHHEKLRVIHNGVNLQEFQPRDPAPSEPAEPAPLILSASRLVEKKGFPDLLVACQRLKAAGHRFRCLIYGDGPLRAELDRLITQLDLRDVVTLAGACTQQELRQLLPQATLFALTPIVTEDGDRDGVPTVLVEAMACGVPVLSTTVAGITELVTHDHNGLLATPHDVETITAQLSTLLTNGEKRRQLAQVARETVAQHFDLRSGAHQLYSLFQSVAGGVA